jgi:hypothetical protein
VSVRSRRSLPQLRVPEFVLRFLVPRVIDVMARYRYGPVSKAVFDKVLVAFQQAT